MEEPRVSVVERPLAKKRFTSKTAEVFRAVPSETNLHSFCQRHAHVHMAMPREVLILMKINYFRVNMFAGGPIYQKYY